MNAVTSTQTQAATHSAVKTFMLLLKREYWENRGGFLWAPLITGLIAWLFTLLGLIGGTIAFYREKSAGHIPFDELQKAGMEHGEEVKQAFGLAGDINFMSGIGLTTAVMVFVVFFYALGSLYDERRDRSVLFWKSLPVSDTQTVMSKVVWALILAPVVSVIIGLLIGFVLWLTAIAGMAINGVPGGMSALTESHPLKIFINVLIATPVYTLWALPTIGWLMLCSAWARRFPFLWAVLLPILGCAMLSLMGGISSSIANTDFPHQAIWYTVVWRGLLSIVPGTWYANESVNFTHLTNLDMPKDFAKVIDLSSSWSAFATLDLWLGAAIGIGMIVLAIRLRRWRDEG